MKKFLKNNYINLILILAVIVTVIFIFLGIFAFKMEDTKLETTTADSFESGWFILDGDTKIEITEVSRQEIKAPTGPITFYRTLPSNINDDTCIMIVTKNEQVRVEVDNHIMYEYGYTVSSPFYSPTGSIRNVIKLDGECSGKLLEMTLTPTSDSIGKSKYDIIIGTENEIFLSVLTDNLILIVICVILFIAAIFFIIQGIIFYWQNKDRNKTVREIYFGLFLLLAAIWSTTDGLLLQLFINNKMISYILFNTSFMLLPIPFALACSKIFTKHQGIYEKYAAVVAIYYIIRMILYITGAVDFGDGLSILHLMMFGLIAFTIYSCITEYHQSEVKYLLYGLMSLVTVVLFSLIIFWANDALKVKRYNYSTGFFIGIFIFMVVYSIGVLKDNRTLFELAAKSQYYELCAHHDKLTELGNRTLFEEELDIIDANLKNLDSLAIIMFDLNNLKKTNDNYGHDVGDELLIATCQQINTIFGEIGQTYRIGGDELVVIIKNKSYSEVFTKLTSFHKTVDEYNENHEVKIDVAIGCAIENDFENIDGKSRRILRQADIDMYNNKELSKNSRK